MAAAGTPAAGRGVTITGRVSGDVRRRAVAVACVFIGCGVAGCQRAEADRAVVRLEPGTTYQTMSGWEATAQAGQLDVGRGGMSSAFLRYRDELFDLAAGDLGINRLRVEVRSGAENPRDYFSEFLSGRATYAEWKRHWYEKVNDNADPLVIEHGGFQFSEVDHVMDHVVVPMRRRLEARRERLAVVLTYVDFARSSFEHYRSPEEYAEFMLAAFEHLRARYGWVPDAVEVGLEPDNTPWTGTRMGLAVAATAKRLRAAGFSPCFVAPSTTDMAKAVGYFDDMIAIPGVLGALRELSYHRYHGVSEKALREIARRATRDGIDTAMLEHIGSGHEDLLSDLTVGRVSAWQQFTLAYPTTDNGAQYYWIDQRDPSRPSVQLGQRTRWLRQYFRHVRAGATRIGASSSSGRLRPVAFVNRDGTYVVVVDATGGGPFVVEGLPAGSYGSYSTIQGGSGLEGQEARIGPGEPLHAALPARGVATLYANDRRPSGGAQAPRGCT
jgi:hypothetical protein